MNDKMNKVAQRIKEQREKEGLSYQDLSNKTGIGKSTLQRYEVGATQKIPLNNLQALSDGLNCTKEYLLGMTICETEAPNTAEDAIWMAISHYQSEQKKGKTYASPILKGLRQALKEIQNLEKIKSFLEV